MNQTKEALAPLIYQIALEEQMVSTLDEARNLEEKLRAFDYSSFERVLRKRAESLRRKALPNSNAFFSSDFYSGQAHTIDSLITALPSILA